MSEEVISEEDNSKEDISDTVDGKKKYDGILWLISCLKVLMCFVFDMLLVGESIRWLLTK